MDYQSRPQRPNSSVPRGRQRNTNTMRDRMRGTESVAPSSEQQEVPSTPHKPAQLDAPELQDKLTDETANKHNIIYKYKKPILMIILPIISVLVIGALLFGILKLTQDPPLIPEATMSKISYTVFFPTAKKGYKTEKDTIKFDPNGELLSFITYTPKGDKIVFSQQPTPESFTDIKPAYEALIKRLNVYSSFDTANGKVSLTKPKELNGTQTAVMNSKGTLLFARPDKNLTDAEWRKLFNSLIIVE